VAPLPQLPAQEVEGTSVFVFVLVLELVLVLALTLALALAWALALVFTGIYRAAEVISSGGKD
jgi:hypothetical protein